MAERYVSGGGAALDRLARARQPPRAQVGRRRSEQCRQRAAAARLAGHVREEVRQQAVVRHAVLVHVERAGARALAAEANAAVERAERVAQLVLRGVGGGSRQSVEATGVAAKPDAGGAVALERQERGREGGGVVDPRGREAAELVEPLQ